MPPGVARWRESVPSGDRSSQGRQPGTQDPGSHRHPLPARPWLDLPASLPRHGAQPRGSAVWRLRVRAAPAFHGEKRLPDSAAPDWCPHSPLRLQQAGTAGEWPVQRGGSQRRAQAPGAGHPPYPEPGAGVCRRAPGGNDLRRHRRTRPRNSRPARSQRRESGPDHRRNPGAGTRCPYQRVQGPRTQVSGQRGGAHHRLWRPPCRPYRDAQTHRVGVALPADSGARPAPVTGQDRLPGARLCRQQLQPVCPRGGGTQAPRRHRAGAGALPRLWLCQHLLGQDRWGWQGCRALRPPLSGVVWRWRGPPRGVWLPLSCQDLPRLRGWERHRRPPLPELRSAAGGSGRQA